MWLKQLKITWNKKKLHLERYYYILHTQKKKKNTNTIHKLIHTHTHTHISSLLTYIMRGLLLNYLLIMLTLKIIFRNLIINKGGQVVFSQLATCK